MSRNVNKVILIGNCTRDFTFQTTSNNQGFGTFGLATNRTWVTSEGEKKSLAEFHSIVVWGKLAELCAKLVKKGKLLYVEGYLKTRSWDNESGIRSFRTEIIAEEVVLLDRKKEEESSDNEVVSNDAEQESLSMDEHAGNHIPTATDDFANVID